MTYLTVAVVLVALLGLVNFLLAVAIMARLREHSQRLSDADAAPQPSMLGIGQTIAEFEAPTTSGRMLTRRDLTAGSLVAFFSPGCSSCLEQLSDFTTRTMGWADGKVIAVVVADPSQSTQSLVRDLEKTAEVVVERHDGTLGTAFQLKGVPAMCLVGTDGRATAVGASLDELLGTGEAKKLLLVRATE
ncbi:hypothetical protein [Micromonospora sp. CA-246542]|uniref:hypothetical protein n=1 Tax=Micromonospora sp. CA-246542 TaxID=3239959 RepID=UPI003D9499D2